MVITVHHRPLWNFQIPYHNKRQLILRIAPGQPVSDPPFFFAVLPLHTVSIGLPLSTDQALRGAMTESWKFWPGIRCV